MLITNSRKAPEQEALPGLYTDGRYIYYVNKLTNGISSPVIAKHPSCSDHKNFDPGNLHTSANVLADDKYTRYIGTVTIECQ